MDYINIARVISLAQGVLRNHQKNAVHTNYNRAYPTPKHDIGLYHHI